MKKFQTLLCSVLLCFSIVCCPCAIEAQPFESDQEYINNVQTKIDELVDIDETNFIYQEVADQISEIDILLLELTNEEISQLDLSKYEQYKTYLDKYVEENWEEIIPNIPLNYIEEELEGDSLLHKKRLLFSSPNSLEASYSSVDKGYITSVKEQNPYGTCWSFAAVAAAEANYALHNYGQKIDLSELQLAWFGTGNYQIPDKMNLITNDGVKFLNGGVNNQLNAGANQQIAMLSLASGIGLSDEIYMPYPDDHNNGSDLVIKNNDHCYHYDYIVTDVDIISMSEMDNIKKAIKQYGALAVSYCHYPDAQNISFYDYYGPKYDSYFHSSSNSSSNHAVTLVGWDDNYSRDNFGRDGKPKPTNNGAWLLKNSWGDWFGDNGYFWISYEEGSLKNSEAYAYTIEKVNEDKDYNLYQHDGGQYQGHLISSSNTVSLANVYTAVRNEKITNIGVMTYNAQVTCKAYVYEIPEGKTPYSSERTLKWSSSQTVLENAGYHLIPVEGNINIGSGKNFAVVLELSVASGKVLHIPVDTSLARMFVDRSTYDEQKKGQCYVKDGDAVKDMATLYGCSNRIKVLCEKSTTEIKPTYKVEHYLQNINDDGYSILKDTFTMEGTAGETATAEAKTYEGFTFNEEKSSSTKSGTIKADNSLVLKMYYSRNSYTLTFNTDGGSSIASIQGKYESLITAPDNPTKDNHVFIGWDEDIPATMPAEDMTFTAQWAERIQGKYKLEVYLQGINISQGTFQDYSLSTAFNNPITDKYVGDLVTYDENNAPSIEGFTFDPEQTLQVGKASGIVTTKEITDSGALVIKLYYLRNEYDLTITNGSGIKASHGAGRYYYQQEVSLYSELEDGYKFKEYSGDKTSTNNDFTFDMPSNNVSLTATGELADYTITYNLDGGTNHASNPSTYRITSDDITIEEPTKEGYFFDGWIKDGTGDPVKTLTIVKGSFKDIELTAKWIDKTVDLSTLSFNENDIVYVDGKKYTVNSSKEIELGEDNVKQLTKYTINNPTGELHSQYPTHLYTYFFKKENGKFTVEHKENFDDIMVYAGASIRMTGKKGIRIITTIPTVKKNQLVSGNYDNYKVMEYGTIMCWKADLNGDEEPVLILNGNNYVASKGAKGRAYSRQDNINAIFRESNGNSQYTNTLVESESNPWTGKYGNDFAMRSYIIICPKDSNNLEDYIVIYGGTVYRSISYVASQNSNTYAQGTDAYNYIHSLIVEG